MFSRAGIRRFRAGAGARARGLGGRGEAGRRWSVVLRGLLGESRADPRRASQDRARQVVRRRSDLQFAGCRAGKPAPDLFLYAARRMGVAPERCAVVEDSLLGVQAAVAAGMDVYGFTAMTPASRLSAATELFGDMRELPDLLS